MAAQPAALWPSLRRWCRLQVLMKKRYCALGFDA